MSKLAQAVLEVQKNAPDLRTDSAGNFHNKFLSLHGLSEALRPVLAKAQLVILQFPTVLDGQPALRTKLIHAETGESEEDTMLLGADKPGPQGQGSAITYARRYSLMAILGLVADEDDDGQAAQSSGGGSKAAPGPARPTQRKSSVSAVASSTPGIGQYNLEGLRAKLASLGKELGAEAATLEAIERHKDDGAWLLRQIETASKNLAMKKKAA